MLVKAKHIIFVVSCLLAHGESCEVIYQTAFLEQVQSACGFRSSTYYILRDDRDMDASNLFDPATDDRIFQFQRAYNETFTNCELCVVIGFLGSNNKTFEAVKRLYSQRPHSLYLLFLGPSVDVASMARYMDVRYDANVYLLSLNDCCKISIWEIYGLGVGRFLTKQFGSWTCLDGLITSKQNIWERRRDLQGITVRATCVPSHPFCQLKP